MIKVQADVDDPCLNPYCKSVECNCLVNLFKTIISNSLHSTLPIVMAQHLSELVVPFSFCNGSITPFNIFWGQMPCTNICVNNKDSNSNKRGVP